MLNAVYVERPGNPDSLDTYDLGEAITRNLEELDAIAEAADVLSLSSFMLPTDGEYLAGLEEHEESMDGDTPDTTGLPESFLATDGLMTVQGLLEYLNRNPQAIVEQEAVKNELETLKGVLRYAQENNVGFFIPMETE